MDVQIMDQPFNITIHGFSGVALNKDYAGTAFRLMDKMWKVVKAEGLKKKGLNIWVYEAGEKVFAGVELDGAATVNNELEHKDIILTKYAYYKHIGPYSLLKQAGTKMHSEIKARGLEAGLPYIEIYGHWTNDETKLETELLVALR